MTKVDVLEVLEDELSVVLLVLVAESEDVELEDVTGVLDAVNDPVSVEVEAVVVVVQLDGPWQMYGYLSVHDLLTTAVQISTMQTGP